MLKGYRTHITPAPERRGAAARVASPQNKEIAAARVMLVVH